MKNFVYTALNKDGKKVKGTISAESIESARATLRGQGLSVKKLAKETILNKELELSVGGSVKVRDLSVFCRQFQSLLGAGVTVIQALEILSSQTENKAFAKTLRECFHSMQKGSTLADTLKKYPKVFPNLLLNMVEAGEASGSLETSFERMALFFEKNARIKGLVKKAMIYPVMIFSVAFIVLIVMTVVVFPRFAKMFADMDTELPAITKVVMAFSNFLIYKWYILVPSVAAVVVFFICFGRTEKGKIFFAKLSLKLPIFGKMTVKNACALFARTLGTLVGAGVSLSEALGITARSMNNKLFREALESARLEVIQGRSLNEPLRKCGLFPLMIPQMVRIGEETGNIHGMLDKAADYYEDEVEMTTGNLTAMMEPMIIVVMGVIVGTMVVAMYMPLIQMYGTMG